MALSEFELHPDRLSTADDRGKRIFVFPADVRGVFRKQRSRVQAVLIVFFLVLPWIKIQGRQALLLNIAERKFEIFGLSLRAHNAPLLIFVLGSVAFGLFFATAIYGRVWCGWACPQTVFIEGVFRRIERWIEGPALERRKLARSPLTGKKLLKRVLKWGLFCLATLVITHSFLAYFVGVDQLAEMIFRPPSENLPSFLFMASSSAVILFDFAWFREQFCTIICPYGRFQSVLMGEGSMIVAYDTARGEPRATPQAKVLAKAHGSKLGDCVNCYRCVQVCPTGIDIRRGLQMECIACTSCIDACDEVMAKTKKPPGLISYTTLLAKGGKKHFMNARAAVYLALCLLSVSALIVSLALIQPVDVELLRAKGPLYTAQGLADGSIVIVNHLKLELSNQSGTTHNLVFSIENALENPGLQLITAIQPVVIEDGKMTQVDVFIRFPKSLLVNGERKIKIVVKDQKSPADQTDPMVEVEKEVRLVGPYL